MAKRVLYISYDGMTDPLGQSQVIPYLKGLSNSGHLIIIVSAEKKERFYDQGEAIRKMLVENEIGWYPVFYSNELPVVSAYLTYRRLQRQCWLLQTEHHFDIVHCRSYIPSLIGLEMKRRSGVKFIFDMRGFWADERVEGKIWNLKNPLYRRAYHFFKIKEKEFLQESDAVVSLTENARQEILSWQDINLHSEKISVIPCCADLDFFSEKKVDANRQHDLRQELGIHEDDFVLSYSGSLGTWYLTEEMLGFFKCLLEKKPQAKFLFITPDKKEKIFSSASKLKIPIERVMVVSANRKDMPSLLSTSDASIFFIRNSFSKKASSPTKMGEFMSMGIPIICNSGVGDVDRIINDSVAGILVHSFTTETYHEAIEKLLKSDFSKQKIREAAQEHFSLIKGIYRYHQIYAGL